MDLFRAWTLHAARSEISVKRKRAATFGTHRIDTTGHFVAINYKKGTWLPFVILRDPVLPVALEAAIVSGDNVFDCHPKILCYVGDSVRIVGQSRLFAAPTAAMAPKDLPFFRVSNHRRWWYIYGCVSLRVPDRIADTDNGRPAVVQPICSGVSLACHVDCRVSVKQGGFQLHTLKCFFLS